MGDFMVDRAFYDDDGEAGAASVNDPQRNRRPGSDQQRAALLERMMASQMSLDTEPPEVAGLRTGFRCALLRPPTHMAHVDSVHRPLCGAHYSLLCTLFSVLLTGCVGARRMHQSGFGTTVDTSDSRFLTSPVHLPSAQRPQTIHRMPSLG